MTNMWDDPRIQRGMKVQLDARRARIAAGEKPLGWKLGFGSPAALKAMEINAPLVGYLMQGALLESDATVSLTGYTKPVAEPEIGVRLGSAIAPGSTPQAARNAINAIKPAIEIADLSIPLAADAAEAILSGNIFQRHVVLGKDARAGGSVDGLVASIVRRGVEAGRTDDPQALTGKIPEMLVHVANLLNAFGEKLSAGDLIICGSVLPPPAIEPDESRLDYMLAPVGPVSVQFTR